MVAVAVVVAVAVGVAVAVVVAVAVGVGVGVVVVVGVGVVVVVVVAVGVAVVVGVVVGVAVGVAVGVVVVVGRKRMIDWTLPVETTEDPPRPVRVLCTDNANMRYKIVFALDGGIGMADPKDGWEERRRFRLRNVAPKPVRREAWLNLSDNGAVWSYITPEAAECGAESDRVACRHIVWNSDGSPVEEDPLRYGVCETCVEKAVKSADEWRAKAEALQAEVDEWNDRWQQRIKAVHETLDRRRINETEALKAEVDKLNEGYIAAIKASHKMRPVVETAVAWVDTWPKGYNPAGNSGPLFDAVRAYQNAQPATSESHEAVVRDALFIEWARMAEPVKNCTTCRFNAPIQVGAPCVKCHDASEWRPRHE